MASGTMKAAVMVRLGHIELQDRPLPEPGPGEVRIKVMAVGICGSDVHYYREGRIGSTKAVFPSILGHEPAGIIDKAGPGAHLAPGTRVAVEPGVPCGKCELCQEGRFNCCPHVKFLASPPMDGIYCQYRVMPEHNCLPLPEDIDYVEAALLEPLAVGMHAVRLARLEIGQTAAIFGCGPIGLATLLAARLGGAGRIYMTDIVNARLAMARELGADDVCEASREDAAVWIKRLTAGRGVDMTFEAAGVQETVTQACLAARIGGQALFIGIPQEMELTIPMHECRRRELLIQYVRRSNGELAAYLRLPPERRVRLRSLATHFFPLDKINKAFDLVHRRADGVIRAMILPHPDEVGLNR